MLIFVNVNPLGGCLFRNPPFSTFWYLFATQNDLVAALRDYEHGGRLEILFGKRAIAIEETLSDVRLTFKDGEVSSYDLVIGADGIHSFTRSHAVCRTSCPAASEMTSMTEVQEGTRAMPKAKYSGVTTIYGLVPTSRLDPCLLAPLDAHQSIRTISPHAGLFAISYARSDKSVIHWFSSRSPPVPPSPDRPEPSPDAVRNQLLETYATFPEPIPALIKATEKIYYWPVYRLEPIPEAWYSEHGRVVLVGDAAHAMPPHAAQGVGMGVEDALFVARIITKLCTQSDAGKDRLSGIVQPSAKLWKREYHEKRLARIKHFVAHAEAQGRVRMDAACTFVGRAREWALWAALRAINALAWVHGRSEFISTVLRLVGLGDVQGWGYDPDQEVIRLDGL